MNQTSIRLRSLEGKERDDEMFTSKRAVVFIAFLFEVAASVSGQTNVTEMPVPTPLSMECVCSDCSDSHGRCKARVGCYSSLKTDSKNGYIVRKGCIATELQHKVICKNTIHRVVCCKVSLCNWNITPPFPTEKPTNSSYKRHANHVQSLEFILLSIFSPVAVLIVLILIFYLAYKHLKKHQLHGRQYPHLRYMSPLGTGHGRGLHSVLRCWSCQKESDLQPFAQRTAAQDLDLIAVIGEGRYGKVWRGLWHGDDVAVKLFYPSQVDLFNNEVSVTNVVGNHQNILRLQHSHSAFLWNHETYSCIVLEYHANGSLYDFLSCRTVNIQEMCSLALSAARGLSHLHGEIYQKEETFSIAHCDIKSKNILVKSNLSCAIGDLGLAVVDKWKDKINLKDKRRGTLRYMAPELLDDTVIKSFESYKRADVYSFGLILWEIVRRTLTESKILEQYAVPFHDMVPAEPTLQDMKKVVVEQQKRPFVPNRWSENSVLESMVKLMKDCWKQNAPARLSSLRVKKNLSKMMDLVKPPPTNTALAEELAVISDVNIHIPESYSENHKDTVIS